jgi:hypothetical protein
MLQISVDCRRESCIRCAESTRLFLSNQNLESLSWSEQCPDLIGDVTTWNARDFGGELIFVSDFPQVQIQARNNVLDNNGLGAASVAAGICEDGIQRNGVCDLKGLMAVEKPGALNVSVPTIHYRNETSETSLLVIIKILLHDDQLSCISQITETMIGWLHRSPLLLTLREAELWVCPSAPLQTLEVEVPTFH